MSPDDSGDEQLLPEDSPSDEEPAPHDDGDGEEEEPEYDPIVDMEAREEREKEAEEQSKRKKRLVKKSDKEVAANQSRVFKRKRRTISDEDEDEDEDGEDADDGVRNVRAARAAVVASDEDEEEDGDDRAAAAVAATDDDDEAEAAAEADGEDDDVDGAEVAAAEDDRDDSESEAVATDDEGEDEEDFRREKGSKKKNGGRLVKKGQGSASRRSSSPAADAEAEYDSEEDVEGKATKEDDKFIDDAGAEEEEEGARYASDDDAVSAGDAPQAMEGEPEDDRDEINQMLKPKKRQQRKLEPEDAAMIVEQFMAKLEIAAEKDADSNRNGEPAIHKLKMLPELVGVLRKRNLQQEFLDRGVLSGLKNWIEPLPDGSLPNNNIRTAILQLLTDLPIDVEQPDRREQLKRSGLGKVVMFLSKLPDETQANRRLARDLVDKWSRPIFEKSTRYEDLRVYEEQRTTRRLPPPKPLPTTPVAGGRRRIPGDDLDLGEQSTEPRPGEPNYQQFVLRPEAVHMDYKIRPEPRLRDEDMKRRDKGKEDPTRQKMNRTLQKMRGPKKKNLRAEQISVEGRGLIKYC